MTIATRRGVVLAIVAVFMAACVPDPGAHAKTGTLQSPLAMSSDPSDRPPATVGPEVSPGAPTRPSAETPIPPPAAPSRPRVLFERRVSSVPRSVADRAWEPVVATHPNDPTRIAVVYVHRGPGAACSTNPVIGMSRDGGRTWRHTPSSPGPRSRRGMGLHPAVAWGPRPDGGTRLYWANMTSPRCGAGEFSLTTSYSDDEGRTWSRLRVERGTPPWVGGFPDIAVDRDPQSPNRGVVYVGYNWYGPGAHGPGFRLLASADLGRTWRRLEIPPVRLAKGAGDWWRIAYRIRTAPDGSVYATWYQVDLRRWNRANIFAKGGTANVRRLGVAMARIRFDRRSGVFKASRPRMAVRVAETAWTASAASALGTAGNVRPDPMWQYGFDIDDTGRLHLAVGSYGSGDYRRPRGSITVARSDDAGRSWTRTVLPEAADVTGHRQSSLRPNLVAGRGYLLVTMRLLDDAGRNATMGAAFAVSTDEGRHWTRPRPLNEVRWRTADLGGVVNGPGLRERAEMTADGDVLWAFGDARLAAGAGPGTTAIFVARIRVSPAP